MGRSHSQQRLVFDLGENSEDTYQVIKPCCDDKLGNVKVEDKPRKRRRFFWWFRGADRPGKLKQLQSLEQKPEWRSSSKKDWYKPIQMLTYPQGPGSCDHNRADRAVNLVTTLPFFGVAYHTFRHRKTKEGQVWGLSLAGVGLGSIIFHSTSGDARPWGRKIDYWAIALSSMSLTRCLFPKARSGLTAGALGLSVINPLAVSTTNALAMEGKFLSRANASPALKPHHRAHLASVLLGAGAFIGEELYPHAPIIHAFWHLCSAYSVATTNCLLADLENQNRRIQKRASTNAAANTP